MSHALGLQDLSYKDRHWHEACFQCFRCKSSLVDKPFAAKEDQLLCTDCYSHEYSSKCQECKKTIMPGRERALPPHGATVHAYSFLPFHLLNSSSLGYFSREVLGLAACLALGWELGSRGVVSPAGSPRPPSSWAPCARQMFILHACRLDHSRVKC